MLMYMKITQGRIRQGTRKEFEAAYKRVVDGPIPGQRARYLVLDMNDRDCAHSVTVWESLAAMRAYEASDLFKKVIEPALQPFFVNDFRTYVSEIALQKPGGWADAASACRTWVRGHWAYLAVRGRDRPLIGGS